MREWAGTITTIVGAIIGLAILSVIVSKRSQAPDVIQASASALSSVISAAVNPVTTAATNSNPGANTFSSPSISLPKLPQSWDDIAGSLSKAPGFKIFE